MALNSVDLLSAALSSDVAVMIFTAGFYLVLGGLVLGLPMLLISVILVSMWEDSK